MTQLQYIYNCTLPNERLTLGNLSVWGNFDGTREQRQQPVHSGDISVTFQSKEIVQTCAEFVLYRAYMCVQRLRFIDYALKSSILLIE